jgi:hypothetical protein
MSVGRTFGKSGSSRDKNSLSSYPAPEFEGFLPNTPATGKIAELANVSVVV